jgi:hypothetical protein
MNGVLGRKKFWRFNSLHSWWNFTNCPTILHTQSWWCHFLTILAQSEFIWKNLESLPLFIQTWFFPTCFKGNLKYREKKGKLEEARWENIEFPRRECFEWLGAKKGKMIVKFQFLILSRKVQTDQAKIKSETSKRKHEENRLLFQHSPPIISIKKMLRTLARKFD